MFLLRRAVAARVASATPASRALLAQPRSFTSFAAPALHRALQPWHLAPLQRRFASDEAAKTEPAQSTVAATENFAQTAAEAPLDDDLTPAQQQVQHEPTDSNATVGTDALNEAAVAANKPNKVFSPRREGKSNAPTNTVYVGNLFYEVSGDQLKQVFSRFGAIEDVKIVYDDRGLSRGFAYVTFQNIDDAQTAVDSLDMQVFEGRSMIVQFHRQRDSPLRNQSRGRESNPPSKTLFIGNMSFEMSDKDLNDLFRDIRNVRDVRVAIDRRTGQPRGFAHADFIDASSAIKAKETLQDKVIYGRKLRVDFSSKPTRNERQPEST